MFTFYNAGCKMLLYIYGCSNFKHCLTFCILDILLISCITKTLFRAFCEEGISELLLQSRKTVLFISNPIENIIGMCLS